MAGTLAKLFISLGLDSSGVKPGADSARSSLKSLDDTSGTMKDHVTKNFKESGESAGVFGKATSGAMDVFKGVVGGMGVSFGLEAVTKGFEVCIDKANEMQKADAITEQAIKSTGEAAHVTASHVNELAMSIQKKTGVDEGQIHTSENLLLTFTNVRNEVGKGNDIFDQATRATTDMSVALGQDAKSSAIQLGKALGDPLKGITALSRVGVTFDAGQKAQIKTMMAHNDILGSQKLILTELNKEFGGAAEAVGNTLPGKFKIFTEGLKTFGASIVTGAEPILLGFINGLAPFVSIIGDVLPPIFSFLANIIGNVFTGAITLLKGAFDALRPVFQPFADILSGLIAELKTGEGFVAAVSNTIYDLGRAFGGTNKDASGAVTIFRRVFDTVEAIFSEVGPFIDNLRQGFVLFWAMMTGGDAQVSMSFMAKFGVTVRTVADTVKSIVFPIFNTLISVAKEVGSSFVKNVGALAEIFITKAIPALQIFWQWAGPKVMEVLGFIKANIPPLVDIFTTYFQLIGEVVKKAFDVVLFVITSACNIIQWVWDHFGSYILNVVNTVFNSILVVVQTVINVVRDVIKFALDIIQGHWSDAWHQIVNVFGDLLGGVGKLLGTILSGLGAIIKDAAGDLVGKMGDLASAIINGLIAGLKKMGGALLDALKGLIPGPIANMLGIHSPSTLMHGYGINLMQGLALGMQSSYDIVDKAVKGIPLSSFTPIAPNVPGLSGTSPLSSAASTSQPQQPITIHQTFTGSDMKPSDVSRQLAWTLKTS
jgi:phage-related protein